MEDNLGFYLWILLMLFITGLLGSLGFVIWKSERQGQYRPTPQATPTRKLAEREPPEMKKDPVVRGE